jgi:hypothetical protein
MLHRAEFEVHTVPSSEMVPHLVRGTSFELIIVTYPLQQLAMEELVEAVRDEASGCHHAGLLLLANPESLEQAQEYVDRGVNRAVAVDWVQSRLWQAVADLLNVAPRVFLRALVQVDVDLNPDNSALCRTDNISRSGMLLRGSDELQPGAHFKFIFVLPGEPEPIKGEAQVVRATDSEREGIAGFGACFVSFQGDGESRLNAFVRAQTGQPG